ncbi:polyadenylate-binding protein 1-B [Thecamonas trahens ATCC 50062]|uniref:Polyadenylate-binding protein n=1 Tax=Thecamonas trahens ATCC 50062 TaxID=461836 RepID=A0A0L0DRS2_THETB|nr:polyadenylate-binding protein 1-B [Thecamonas trahens ATCC 50062]KNC54123.1 polyadenylate-binding protein 1-B [Thecamonas trahens ATCC 50062]|eukprot:XP_013753945.1 polyadenylate-binding protein 1-B [Thecamonas trahens ATCC 50062]
MNTPYASPSLYVGDLAADISEALLFDLFNVVGAVSSIRVCRDAMTRRSLGYAYVNFHNVADAERALDTMNYTLIRGKPCRIMWSHRDPTIRKSGVGNIFIKNLDKNIDNKSLYDAFSAFGNILSCKVMINESTGESLGYGFVHYETQKAADEAIAKLNGMLLNNKQVYVGKFVPRSERAAAQGEQRFTNVYVKNIPLDWDEAKLEAHFTPAGTITSAVVRRSAEGASLGFGFVNFETPEAAKAAVDQFNGQELPAPAAADGEDAAETQTLFVSRAQKKAEREKELKKKFEKLRQERLNKYQGINLYVKNLDDSIDDDALREAFAEFGTISSAKVMRTPEGASRGFGFVCFTTQEEASRAVSEMSSRILGSKPIYVALAERREVRRAKLEAQHSQHTPARGMPQQGAGMPGMPYPGQGPMFYAGPQRNNFGVYPQQMVTDYPQQMSMPRPRFPQQGQPPAGAGRGAPMQGGAPNYMMMGRGPQGQPQMPLSAQQPVLMPQQAQQQAQGAGQQDPLTPSEQKAMLGERLFPLIQPVQPRLAGKITGMLLEMDNGELLNLLESSQALQEKIAEAVNVLNQHAAGEAQADA